MQRFLSKLIFFDLIKNTILIFNFGLISALTCTCHCLVFSTAHSPVYNICAYIHMYVCMHIFLGLCLDFNCFMFCWSWFCFSVMYSPACSCALILSNCILHPFVHVAGLVSLVSSLCWFELLSSALALDIVTSYNHSGLAYHGLILLVRLGIDCFNLSQLDFWFVNYSTLFITLLTFALTSWFTLAILLK
jgi:hypothetical protein